MHDQRVLVAYHGESMEAVYSHGDIFTRYGHVINSHFWMKLPDPPTE